jgi:CRISPR/Cas system-associated exonuclease Cas4 (RecB family)
MSRKVEELSASGVKTYKQCPKQFWYDYISEIEPVDEGEVEHFQIGNAVHDSLEEVLQSDIDLTNEDEILSQLKSEERKLDYNYDDDSKVSTSFQTASRWISSFVDSVKHVEEKWSIEKDGFEYRGLADLVADLSIGEETYNNSIVDWKTGSENEEWKERVQGGMYAEMHYELYGEYPDAIVFVYLAEETQSVHRRVQDGEVFWNEVENKYWTEIEKYKAQILQSQAVDEWEAKPDQSKCFFCEYKYHCADSGVGAENVGVSEIEMGDWI